MTILNPNKYIRKAYVDAFFTAIAGIPVWEDYVPINANGVTTYILISSQSKNETVNAKSIDDLTYFEWICTIDLNIYHVQPLGASMSAIVDDLAERVISIVREGIPIPNFSNKNTKILESLNLSSTTKTQSVNRTLLKFEHWLNRAETE